MNKEKSASAIPILAIVAVCIGVAIAATACIERPQHSGDAEARIDWNLTLIGDCEKVLSYDELKAMPSYEGHGGFFSTVGSVNGPFKCKGTPLKELCDLVGGINATDTVRVYASDGYMMVFTYDQVMGDFITYDPELKEVPHRELEVILMYEQDGAPLLEYDGRPLRIAIVSKDKLLTEGHYWIKWVDKVEIWK